MARSKAGLIIAKIAVWLACLAPLASLLYRYKTDDLGANPIEFITHATGDWTIRLLLVTLAITPLRRISGWNVLIKFRRLTGLFAFFYGILHFTTYVWLDKYLDAVATTTGPASTIVAAMWKATLQDIAKRPFITVGFAALLLLVPLAITSTQGWIRRLGKNWGRLHQLIYFSAALGIIHYWWLVKADHTLPGVYAIAFAVVMLPRAFIWANDRRRKAAASVRQQPAT